MFNKVIKNFIIKGGEIINLTSLRDSSIYDNNFNDENFIYSHNREGLLSMDINGKDENNFQFFITLRETPILDKKNIVFGQILKRMEVLKEIEALEIDSQNKPKTKVIISNCGEIKNGKEITPDNYKKKNNEKNLYLNEIIFKYRVNYKEDKIRLFGNLFVNNNYFNCKIVYEGIEYYLSSHLKITNYELKKKEIIIKLKGINNIIDASEMFSDCSSLIELPDISKWDTKNVTNMSGMFNNCSSLKELPDISNWNMNNVTSLILIFSQCILLKELPDISKWNTSNITNMAAMFFKCSSLKVLPDISKWNTSNVTNIEGLFCNCSSLKILPDISKWNTKKAIEIGTIFSECSLFILIHLSKIE